MSPPLLVLTPATGLLPDRRDGRASFLPLFSFFFLFHADIVNTSDYVSPPFHASRWRRDANFCWQGQRFPPLSHFLGWEVGGLCVGE